VSYLLVLVAFVCAGLGELVALGADVFGSTWDEWVAAALCAYLLSLLVPWAEARRGA
jgi:hypothetical protein